MTNILITGSTGFIGNKFLGSLDKSKFSIRLLGRSKVSGHKNHICDFEKESIPQMAFDNVEIVVHLAGYAHSNKNSKEIEKKNMFLNYDVTKKIIEYSINANVKKFIYLSSVKSSEYNSNKEINSEEDVYEPKNSYGKSKMKAEMFLRKKCEKTNMKYIILKPALVYGPNVKGNLRAMKNAIALGYFPPPPAINNMRSMVHVDDVVNAIHLVMTKVEAHNETFIVTDNNAYSTRMIYESICYSINKKPTKLSIHKRFYEIFSILFPFMKNKIQKIINSEYYSSKKINTIGFEPKKNLNDFNISEY
tara:strand:+ start:3072 stop:3986 length:915 start_codon:yes stop_codon:yes gene_type:complete